jgi:hypothetical protein
LARGPTYTYAGYIGVARVIDQLTYPWAGVDEQRNVVAGQVVYNAFDSSGKLSKAQDAFPSGVVGGRVPVANAGGGSVDESTAVTVVGTSWAATAVPRGRSQMQSERVAGRIVKSVVDSDLGMYQSAC